MAPPKAVPSPKAVDGPLLGNGDVGVVLAVDPARARGSRLVLAYYISKNDFWMFNNDDVGPRNSRGPAWWPNCSQHPTACGGPIKEPTRQRPFSAGSFILGAGGVNLTFPTSTKLLRLTQRIDVGTISALVAVRGVNYTVISWLSQLNSTKITPTIMTTYLCAGDDENCVPSSGTTSSSARTESISLDVATWTFDQIGGHDNQSGVAWATRQATGNARPVAIAFATATVGRPSAGGVKLLGAGGGIVTAVTSSIDQDTNNTMDVRRASVQAAAQAADVGELLSGRTDTAAWFERFWNASTIALPSEPLFEEYWFKSLYMLAACSRGGRVAPGLWGSWLTTDTPLWHGGTLSACLSL